MQAEVAAHRAARLENINTIVSAAEVEIFRNPGTLDAARERVLATIGEANVTPAQRARMIQEAESRLVQIAIERHLTNNNPGAAQALLGVDRNVTALGGLNAARASARITRAVEEARERAGALQFNEDLRTGRALVDPANQDHRRRVNEWFTTTNGPQQLAAMDTNAVTTVAGFATRYGVVPTSAISILQGMLANGSHEQQIFALQSISTIEASRPGAFENTPLHRTARAEADDFRFLTTGVGGLGLDPAEALRRIHAQRDPAFQERAEARRTLLQAPDGPLRRRTEAELVGLFDNSYWTNPAIGNPPDRGVMLSTYQQSFRHHFVRTGDEAMALSAAQADVRRVYGVTNLSGDGSRVVRRPIELIYPAIGDSRGNMSHEYIRRELVEIIRTERGITVRPEDIFIEANRQTEEAISRGGIAAGHPPPYAFYWRVRDAQGVERFETIPGRMYTPDVAGARRAATEAAEGTRQESGRAARVGRDTTAGGPYVGRDRRTPRPLTIDPAIERPVVLGAEIETLFGRDRERVVRERRRQSVMDLLGWGARVTTERGN